MAKMPTVLVIVAPSPEPVIAPPVVMPDPHRPLPSASRHAKAIKDEIQESRSQDEADLERLLLRVEQTQARLDALDALIAGWETLVPTPDVDE